MCADTKLDQTTSRNMVENLIDRVGKLEFDHEKLQPKVSKMSDNITDLQCRSVRDNLIFTGVPEPEPIERTEGSEGEPEYCEDVEYTLITFLKDEMDINDHIGFHRVLQINIPDRNDDYPRPIVAKFYLIHSGIYRRR